MAFFQIIGLEILKSDRMYRQSNEKCKTCICSAIGEEYKLSYHAVFQIIKRLSS